MFGFNLGVYSHWGSLSLQRAPQRQESHDGNSRPSFHSEHPARRTEASRVIGVGVGGVRLRGRMGPALHIAQLEYLVGPPIFFKLGKGPQRSSGTTALEG